jgi:Fe-S-cluster-containing dehydrogenase component
MVKRLVIDLNKCDACEQCTLECASFHRARATDHGVLSLRESATFALVCRRCEDPACVAACKFEALERQADGVLKRYNLRCVSCRCCSHACPFGTIYPETLAFFVTTCDFCVAGEGSEPPCVPSCVNHALSFEEAGPSEDDGVYLLADNLAVRAPKWDKKDV